MELCKDSFRSSVRRLASLYSYIYVTEYSVTNGTFNIFVHISVVLGRLKLWVSKGLSVTHSNTMPIFMEFSFSSSWKHQQLFPVIKCSNKIFTCQIGIMYICLFFLLLKSLVSSLFSSGSLIILAKLNKKMGCLMFICRKRVINVCLSERNFGLFGIWFSITSIRK